MDFSKIMSNPQQFVQDFLNENCIINGNSCKLEDIEKMGCNNYSQFVKRIMPLRLYHYFPNKESEDKKSKITVNHSIEALKNNTVFLQTPTEFDDVYDSDITIDFKDYEHLRLIEYCQRCRIEVDKTQSTESIGNSLIQELVKQFAAGRSFDDFFIKKPQTKAESLSNETFILRIISSYNQTQDFSKAVASAIQEEYNEYVRFLKETFRTFCFATTPYSQLMWGTYGNCHKGFCVEYTILPDDDNYKDVFNNLYPVIYCKKRSDITSRLVAAKDKEPTDELLWDLYSHGVLRKSIDWAYQNEWRLVLPKGWGKETDYNLPFFPITKVYLGNNIPAKKRKEIIDICHERSIPYVGIKRRPDVFEMMDCDVKCEDCPNYLNSLEKENN